MGFCNKLCFWKSPDRKENKKALCRIFSLKEIQTATNNFNYDNKLGEGTFGSVYWGQLWDGSQIAVKRFKVWSDKAEAEFVPELGFLSNVKHKNLLRVRGYCVEGQERLIIYDFVPNLSLLYHLHGPHASDCVLDWKQRMNIAIGAAEGIAYLHHTAMPHIVHRDIKASNVLLDSEFQALVVDFGLAKFIPEATSHDAFGSKGSLGYHAPEFSMNGEASERCDVYSFGVLLLEIVTGKWPISRTAPTGQISLVDWALPLARECLFIEILDPNLKENFVMPELRRVVLVALICCQSEPEKRPTMSDVVKLLKDPSKQKLAMLENNELFKQKIPDASEVAHGETTTSGQITSE